MTSSHTRIQSLLPLAADAVGVPDLDLDANLFALGIDSIGILRMVEALGEQGYAIDLADVYQQPVVRQVLEQARWTGESPATVRLPPVTPMWLSNIRHRLTQSFPDPQRPTHHQDLDRTIPRVRRYQGTAPVEVLQRNIETILRRHPHVRWSFQERHQTQVTSTGTAIGLDRHGLPSGASEQDAVRDAVAYATAPFDLRGGRLIRFGLWQLDSGFVLALGVDHIIADAHSLEVLWRQWLAGDDRAAGAPAAEPPAAQELTRVALPPAPTGVSRDPAELAIELPVLEGTTADREGPALLHHIEVDDDVATAIHDLWRIRAVPYETTFVAAYAAAYAELTGAVEVPVTRNDGHRSAGVDDDHRVGWFSGWDATRIRTGNAASAPAELLEEVKRELIASRVRASGTDPSTSYVPFFSRYPDLGPYHPRAEFLFRREVGTEPVPTGVHGAAPVDAEKAEPRSILGSELYVTQTGDSFACELMFRAGRYRSEAVDGFVASFQRHLAELPRHWAEPPDGDPGQP